MASDLCRVRTVRLRAPRDDLVRRGATLLEDALRTASRPESPGRRLLVVRSLHLGSIRADHSAVNVAIAVEAKLRELELRAVHALDAAASSRDVVFFRDDVEAYASLAVRIAAQRSTDAWFWSLAVPVWSHGMPRDEALRALLFGVLETSARAGAGAALIATLAERGAVDPLLAALRPQDASALVTAFGWRGAAVGNTTTIRSDRAPDLSPAKMRVLERWAARWGSGDVRSTWLAGALLVSERMARVADPDLPAVAQSLAACAVGASGPSHRTARTPDTLQRVSMQPRTVREAGREHRESDAGDTVQASPPSVASALPVAPAPVLASARLAITKNEPPPSPRDVSAPAAGAPPSATPTDGSSIAHADVGRVLGAEVEALPHLPPTDESPGPAPQPLLRHDRDRTAHADASPAPSGEAPRASNHLQSGAATEQSVTRSDAELPGKAQQRDAAVRQPTKTRTALRVAAEPDAERGARQPVRTAGESLRGSADGPRSPKDEQQTDYAGLFFLLRLASHLGMASFLAEHRELVVLDFPSCLLRHVAQRLALPPDDPALAVLQPADDAASRWDAEFVVPEAWSRSGVAAGPRLVRRAVGLGGDARLALTDASWSLVLALWRDKAPDPVHSLSAGVPLTRGRSLRESLAMDLLLGSWLTAMRRWSHRHAGLGLRSLVTRPGRIAATRTHLDVFFKLPQIDIGVRRAGLDIDPGWLPWFGRVVAYHYAIEGLGRAR